jgi:hypothetical protein
LAFGREHGGARALLGADRIVQILLADGVLGGERPDAVQVGDRGVERRLLLRNLALRRLQRCVERLRVDLEQRLPGTDEVALDVEPLVEKAFYTRTDLDFARALRLPDELERTRGYRVPPRSSR